MSVSSEFVLRPILTAGSQGNGPPNEGESQPSKKEEEEEYCETPKGEESRIANSALPSCPDPPRKRRCVVIGKRTNPQIELIAVEKEEMDRLFVRRDRLPVGCGGAGAMSVKLGSKRKRCSVSDEC